VTVLTPAGTAVLEFARALVRVESLSGREGGVAALVRREMERLGYDRIETDEYGNVLGLVQGRGRLPGRRPVLLFDAHMDTMPATSPEEWQHPPFAAEIDGGRLYGRGACDVKSGLAAMVHAAASLDRERWPGALWMVASVGEEVIEGAALAQVLQHIRPDAVVIAEPTLLRLGIGHKGRATVSIETRGRPAHTSQPHLGENAIYKMLPVLERLKHFPPREHPEVGARVVELVEVVSTPFPGNSIVPDGCRARYDCRLTPGETRESLLEEFRRLAGPAAAKLYLSDVTLACYTGRHIVAADFHAGWLLPTAHPLVQAARRRLRSCGRPDDLFVAPYSTNATASAGSLGIPSLVYGPGSIAQAHAVDEWIDIGQIEQAVTGYRALAEAIAETLTHEG
jgi:putative selenium metabolism hydrolase